MTTMIQQPIPKKEDRPEERKGGVEMTAMKASAATTQPENDTRKHTISPSQSTHYSPHIVSDRYRLKTYGEKKFNWLTYFVIAMLGNEAASTVITHARENWAKKYYDPFKKIFTDLKGKKYVPEYVWNGGLPKVLVALIGGMLMVPFVKHMEDHKGEKVREYDRKHYGRERCDTDPAIVAAHEEMDQSPKQSWGSLLKGRVVTIVTAIGMDSLMGWKDAPSTKLVDKMTKPNSFWRKYSSMDRVATEVSEKILNVFKINQPGPRRFWNEWIQTASWLLVFSSALTFIFYASSKIFARKRDEKIERREHAQIQQSNYRDDAADSELGSNNKLNTERRPESRITHPTHEKSLVTLPTLQVS